MGRKKADIGEYYTGEILWAGAPLKQKAKLLYQVTKWVNSVREIEFAIKQLRKYGTPCQVRAYKARSGEISFAVFRQDDFERAQVR